LNNIKIRPYTKDDYAFVKSTWIKNQALNVPFKSMRHSDFFSTYSPIIDNKLNELDILIACNPDLEDQAFAYLVREHRTLHFIYVKRLYRNMGIASFLLRVPNLKLENYTHQSSDKYFWQLIKKYKITYNPFLFWRQKDDEEES